MATLFFLSLEALIFFQMPHPVDYLQEFFQAKPELIRQTGLSANHLPWIPHVLLTGLLCFSLVGIGYLLEKKYHRLYRAYTYLQKTYPAWYRRWPASWRELLLVLTLWGGLTLLMLIPQALTGKSPYPLLHAEILWLFFCLGLAIAPFKRYQTLQKEDRPEKPVQAILHQWAPTFPTRYALLIGQIYLRILLPCFCLFMLLVPGLELGYLHLQPPEYIGLLGGILSGLGCSWLFLKESHLDSACLNENLSALSLRMFLAGTFLLLGAFSENGVLLLVFSHFAGLTAGTY